MIITVWGKFRSLPNLFKITVILFLYSTLLLMGMSIYYLVDFIIAWQNYQPDPTSLDPPLIGLKFTIAVIYGFVSLILTIILFGLLKGWNPFRYIAVVLAILFIFWGFPISVPISALIVYTLLADPDTYHYFNPESKPIPG